MSFMDRARERAYASGFGRQPDPDRLAELEREVAVLREEVTKLQGDMRGVNEWVAARPVGRCAPECGWSPVDDYRAAEIQSGDR